jgi:hypothetical protein
MIPHATLFHPTICPYTEVDEKTKISYTYPVPHTYEFSEVIEESAKRNDTLLKSLSYH